MYRSDLTVVLRLALFLDPHSPFLELSALAAHDVYPGESLPGAGIIRIGWISGREYVVVVNDATVKGGSYYLLTVSLLALHFSRTFASHAGFFFRRMGEGALACPGDHEGTWFTLCLRWCVFHYIMIPVLSLVACYAF
jgi:hypothetical protein